ncbi:MAG: oligosaccharide flippase family protein [Candidatus Limnocylindria bacterium]
MSLRRLARESALYTVGNIAPKIGAFLLLPVYVRFLSQADYGAVALLSSFSGILAVVYHMGVDGSLMRLHFDTEGRERARLYLTLATFTFVVATGLTVILALALGPSFETWFAGTPFMPLGLLALLIAWAGSMQFVPSVLFRASGQPGRFLAVNLGAFVVSSVASIILIVGFDLRAPGVLIGQLIANLAVLGVTAGIVVRLGNVGLDLQGLRAALKLGLPLLPHQLSAWALRLGDRWLIALLIGLPALEARAQIGVYAVGYQLGYVVTIFVSSFNAAWSPYFFRIGDRPDAPRFYADMTTVVLAGIMALATGVSALAPEIVGLVARPGYEAAADVLPVIAFASVLQGAYTMFVTVIFFTKRTGPLALITFASAALNLTLNVGLIPVFGIMGAAWSTAGAYAFFAAATYLFARRDYPVRIAWLRLGTLLVLGIGAVFLARVAAPGPSVLAGAIHLVIGIGYTVVAVLACMAPIARLRTLSRGLPADRSGGA